jgi:hypothetical protein
VIRWSFTDVASVLVRRHWLWYLAGAALIAVADGTRWGFVLIVLAAAVDLVISAFWNRKSRQRAHRVARGLCVRCGYNLHGNASMICPECGEPYEKYGRMRMY